MTTTTPSVQKQIMDKIQRYRNEAILCDARNNFAQADRYRGRADGLEEAYKIFISEDSI
jgi:hypothetical protein